MNKLGQFPLVRMLVAVILIVQMAQRHQHQTLPASLHLQKFEFSFIADKKCARTVSR